MRALTVASFLVLCYGPLAAAADPAAPSTPPTATAADRPLDCNLPYASFGYKPVVVKDFAEMAEKLDERASDGNYCAQFELGMMYLNGVGVTKNPMRGIGLLREAAEQGHADAQHTLGLMYNHGRNVERNVDTAVEWYYKAGLSYLKVGNRRLALREIDYISRERPGHPHIQQLQDAVNEDWLQAQRMSAN
ncbi:tetratricopeptide repeat protein [Endothiovibrio diazotrophicus]